MNRLDRWLLISSNLLAGVSGVIYGWMRYFVVSADPYAVVNHPAQPFFQHLHIWTAPLLAIVLGHFLFRHAIPYAWIRTRAGRRSGWCMLATGLPMIFSGYLLQTSVEESWRTTWIVIHVASSLIWLTGVIAHLVSHLRVRLSVDRPDRTG